MIVGSKKLPRDTKENIRLCKIAYQLTDLKNFRQILAENKNHYEFLIEFKEFFFCLLEETGVGREFSERFLILNPLITPELLETFRQTESRKFWE